MMGFLYSLACAYVGYGCVTAPLPPAPAPEQKLPDAAMGAPDEHLPEPVVPRPPGQQAAAGAPMHASANALSSSAALPAWQRYAVPAPPTDGKPTIAVMIDDMGLNKVQTERAERLPGPITLSWMPYAVDVTTQAAEGAAHGHETMLHLPVEALGHTDPGPDAMRSWLPDSVNLAHLKADLDRLPNAVGLNQHEGSIGSLSTPLWDLVGKELHDRGLLFVDSMVITHSVSLKRVQAAGVPAVPRDVFLDNSADPGAIRAQLAEAEAIAKRYGHVIVIGHPRQHTMDVLSVYLPTVAARGFVLWPVSATVAAQLKQVVAGNAPPHTEIAAPAPATPGEGPAQE